MAYTTIPGVDETYNFPPEIIGALRSSIGWDRGPMEEGANPDLLEDGGLYHIRSMTHVNSLVGTPLPVLYPGTFIHMSGTSLVKSQVFMPYNDEESMWWRVAKGATTWMPWRKVGDDRAGFYRGDIEAGTDVDAIEISGAFSIRSRDAAESLVGTLPQVYPGIFVNIYGTTLVKFQMFMPYSPASSPNPNAGIWWRTGASTTGYTDWKNATANSGGGGGGGTSSPSNGLANSLHLDYLENHFGNTVYTNGLPAVAIRHDHGLSKFNQFMRQTHESLNIPYSLALGSRHWDHAENAGVTPAIVNSWVEGGLCEIWNHGTSPHNNAVGYDANYDYWVNGLDELKQQLPAAFIPGVVIPGTGVSGQFDGLGGASRPDMIYNSIAGRLILESHAIITGAFPNTKHRVLDGKIRQGQGHFGIESRSAAEVIEEIQLTQANKTGLQLMTHPSRINVAGYYTDSDYTAVMNYIATERNAGRLAVLTPAQLLMADSRS